jgi:hypothetical protein
LLHYGARIKKKEIETTKDCTLGRGFNGTYDATRARVAKGLQEVAIECASFLFLLQFFAKIVNKFYIKKDAQQFDSKENSFVTLKSKANPQRSCGEV